MSTPIVSGGGRRPSEGARKSFQFYGRLAAALAAGGVFAVLAYEPPAHREWKKAPPAADRQDVVTEDGVLPLLDERRARVETEDAVGLARTSPQGPSRTTGVGTGDLPSNGQGGFTRADQDEELLRHTTAAPHSRGPPGD